MAADPCLATRGLDVAAVIAAWESGFDPATFDPPADQPLGARMRDLLGLRVASFGPVLEAVADCPGCGEVLDVTLDLRDLLGHPLPADTPCAIRDEGFEALIRAPRPADLDAAAGTADPARALFEACILAATRDDRPIAAAALPDSLRAAAAEALAARDPLTEVSLGLTCPACGTASSVGLAAEAVLAQDIAEAAPRLLAEVARLACAFGWTEQAILAMTPARRRAYLALAG